MPRLPIDYANTVIYKIVCNDLSITELYVGSTTDFVRRRHNHKHNTTYVNGHSYNNKVYKIIRENGGFSNWSMIEIEKYPCADVNEARAKEREWFETLNSRLNMVYPQRNRAEYREMNKENRIVLNREHYQANREKILAQVHAYADSHKQEISERGKLNRVIHKAEIKEYRSKTFLCDCGVESTHDHKSRHLKSKFHLQFVSTTSSPSL